MTLTQGLLDHVAGLLNRDATNYTVFLRLYQLPMASFEKDLEACVRWVVGAGAEIDGVEEINPTSLVVEIEALLRYAGDPGAGPSDSVLRSKELSDLLIELKNGVLVLASQAKAIKRFGFKAGHPAYPVFWDFAYAFFTDDTLAILIGSSSD